jgi:cell division protein FtsB
LWAANETDGLQTLAPAALIPMLVKALQELSAKNDALEARITALEAK